MEYFFPPNRPAAASNLSVEEQLSRIWDYLYDLQQKLNRNTSEQSPTDFMQNISKMIESTAGKNDGYTGDGYLNGILAMKKDLIKNAAVLVSDSESIAKALMDKQSFNDNFSNLLRNTKLNINGESVGFLQLYEKTQAHDSKWQHYFKGGLLNSTGTPVYGIEIGLVAGKIEVTDSSGQKREVSVAEPIKIRITPEEWSIWQNGQKLCGVSKSGFCIPQANITGGTVHVTEPIGTVADQKAQSSVTNLSQNHSKLFDNLKPRAFQFGSNTTGPTHLGFVAQEVEQAITNAGLTANDAALIASVPDTDSTGAEAGTVTKTLRYEEIIALLVQELQTVKTELAAVKAQLNEPTA